MLELMVEMLVVMVLKLFLLPFVIVCLISLNINKTYFLFDLIANKTHPCDSNNEEYLCNSRECISSLLSCDGKIV